jgi:prophage regulatory protein
MRHASHHQRQAGESTNSQPSAGPVVLDRPEEGSAPPALAAAVARSRRLLRFPAIRERTGLSRSTIWRLERRGAFPRHRRISANAVAWLEEEVELWIGQRVSDERNPACASD